jgi:hypothetical protein
MMEEIYIPKCFGTFEYAKKSMICRQCHKYKECGEKQIEPGKPDIKH